MPIYKQPTDRWYLERIIFAVAGMFIIASVILGIVVSQYFLYFTLFVGIVMKIFALTGYCPMAITLHKIGVKEK